MSHRQPTKQAVVMKRAKYKKLFAITKVARNCASKKAERGDSLCDEYLLGDFAFEISDYGRIVDDQCVASGREQITAFKNGCQF